MAIFDQDSFRTLIDGDKRLFGELLALYSADYPTLLTQLREALAAGNSQQVEVVAHRLRGMVRNFFAEELANTAAALEDNARAGDLSAVTAQVDQLALGLQTLENELARFLKTFG